MFVCFCHICAPKEKSQNATTTRHWHWHCTRHRYVFFPFISTNSLFKLRMNHDDDRPPRHVHRPPKRPPPHPTCPSHLNALRHDRKSGKIIIRWLAQPSYHSPASSCKFFLYFFCLSNFQQLFSRSKMRPLYIFRLKTLSYI